MTARDIQTGVERLAESLARSTTEDQTRQWRDLRNKVDSILLSTTTYKTDEVREACRELDTMSLEERRQLISQKWGPAYLQRVDPLLQQLESLEKKMHSS